MNKQAQVDTASTEVLTLLSISPYREDHSALKNIAGNSKWTLLTADNLFRATSTLLQTRDISIILCESELRPGSWIDVVKHIHYMQDPPLLIVTSKFADDHLWSVALNLG